MAKYLVPPRKLTRVVLLKCFHCGGLYSPEGKSVRYLCGSKNYEKCPFCGYEHNSDGQKIPLWKYNLIKWSRGGMKEEDEGDEDGMIDIIKPEDDKIMCQTCKRYDGTIRGILFKTEYGANSIGTEVPLCSRCRKQLFEKLAKEMEDEC